MRPQELQIEVPYAGDINPEFYAMRQLSRGRSVSVGYVHFLPETLDKSLKLPDHIRDVFYRYVIRFYKSMDYLVTVNPYFIGELEKYGIPRGKVTYIPNFVSAEQFYPLPAEEKAALREKYGIIPSFKMVDTCAAEFSANTPYFYSTYDGDNEAAEFIAKKEAAAEGKPKKKKVLVFGSGPIRIGQGIEFDYCSVHAVWALQKLGCETVIINNNPETVSTDFDTADRLYFEPLTPEDVTGVVEAEKPDYAIVQFGGQTAINLAAHLEKLGVPILGTPAWSIDAAEDREKFDVILEKCGIPRPAGHTVMTEEEAVKAADELGYPVLVRPSYVLGGQGMEIAYKEADVREFMQVITRNKVENPVLVDKYMMGREIEVDAICDGDDILIPASDELITSVDTEHRQITMQLPEGLLDI